MVVLPLVGLIWVFLNGCAYCQTPVGVNIGGLSIQLLVEPPG